MRRRIAFSLSAAALAAGLCALAAQAQTARARPAGAFRALLVGVDEYQHVTPLKGSVADIIDLEASLRKIGARDIKTMINASVTRGSLLVEFENMVTRSEPGDTVFLSISGHGAQEPERVKGSAPDGMDTVFLMPGFDPKSREGYGEKIVDKEFNHFIKRIEDKGARVVFIADTCSGGGLARDVDPRGAEMSYRAVKYTPIEDELKTVSTRADAFLSPTDFKTSTFLAAVDRQSKAPEIRVPGVGFRGALSYAVARGIEGAADLNGDGQITTAELFEYSRRVTYQLSDQRQLIVTAAAQATDPEADVIVRFDRGISVIPADPGKPGQAPSAAPPAAKPPANAPAQTPVARPVTPPLAPGAAGPVRVASLDGQGNRFTGLSVLTPYEVVAPGANPDVLWDPATREVLAGGDVIARNVDRNDLPGVIERTAAVRLLKLRAARTPQSIRVIPDDKLHHKGARVEIEVGGLAGKSLVLFNIAGDGTVQMIYPIGSDAPIRSDAIYRLQLLVREPLGADQIVAVTASRRLAELETAIRQLDRRRNPMKISELISQYAAADVLVGAAGLFTGP